MLTKSSGIASKFWTILLGRAISGIGGAGMVGLVAVIIAGKHLIRWEKARDYGRFVLNYHCF